MKDVPRNVLFHLNLQSERINKLLEHLDFPFGGKIVAHNCITIFAHVLFDESHDFDDVNVVLVRCVSFFTPVEKYKNILFGDFDLLWVVYVFIEYSLGFCLEFVELLHRIVKPSDGFYTEMLGEVAEACWRPNLNFSHSQIII